MTDGVIDVWMQHPTLRHSQHEMFDSLRRWTRSEAPTEALPIAATIAMMDEGGVDIGLSAAWYGPAGDLILRIRVATDSAFERRGNDIVIGDEVVTTRFRTDGEGEYKYKYLRIA